MAFCLAAVGMAAVGAWCRPVPKRRVAQAIDRERGLPDSVLSACELDERSDAWRAWQLRDTLRRAEGAHRRSRRFDWTLALGLASLTILSVSVLTQSISTQDSKTEDPLAARQGEELEQLFQDWEQAQKESPDPELEKLLEDVRPLRDMIAKGQVDQKEMFVQLSKVEDRLAAMQDRMARESLDAHAADLAEAMEGVDGMQPLAAALRSQDYAQAQKAADKLQKQLSEPDAKAPSGAQQAASRMETAAEKMSQSGQQSAAQAMQSLSQGAKKNDASKMADGMKKLSQCMGQQQAKKDQRQAMALCRSQLGMCKQCMGNGESMSRGLSLIPKLSMSKGKGNGAGSDIDLMREKNPTDFLGTGSRESLAGVEDAAGDSETETVRTTEAPRQETVSVASADFADYRKLSEEAIEDESLPLAHRMTIRRYFESIRPVSEDPPINEPR